MNDLYKIIEIDDDKKWFIVSRTLYKNEWYSYLIRLNENENDFLDEYRIIKTIIKEDAEYVQVIKNKETLKAVIPLLLPDVNKYLANTVQVNK